MPFDWVSSELLTRDRRHPGWTALCKGTGTYKISAGPREPLPDSSHGVCMSVYICVGMSPWRRVYVCVHVYTYVCIYIYITPLPGTCRRPCACKSVGLRRSAKVCACQNTNSPTAYPQKCKTALLKMSLTPPHLNVPHVTMAAATSNFPVVIQQFSCMNFYVDEPSMRPTRWRLPKCLEPLGGSALASVWASPAVT